MRIRRRRAILVHSAVALGLALSAAADAVAPPDALARCVAIAAAPARLACYDTAAGRMPTSADSSLPGSTGPTPAAAAAAAAPAAAPPGFGLQTPRPHAQAEGPESVQALVVSVTQNHLGQARVLLDNGQTWAISGDEVRLNAGDQVTIARAALGSFLMTTPSRHSYRVQRLR